MFLVRRTREQGFRTDTVLPPARERTEAAAEEVTGEVFRRDRELAAFPQLSDLGEDRQKGQLHHGLDAVLHEQLVDDGVS
jgi:hypothetical protein